MFTKLRTGLGALLVLGIFSAFYAAPAMAIPSARLTISSTTLTVGDIFTIDVYVDNTNAAFDGTAYAFDAFDFSVNALPTGITYNGATNNSTYFDPIDPAILSTPLNVYGDTGTGGSTLTGLSILLTSLSFTADNVGAYSLGINSINDGGLNVPSNMAFIDLAAALSGINVNPAGTSTVPEPSTLLLLGTGLVGVAVIKRVRFKKTGRATT